MTTIYVKGTYLEILKSFRALLIESKLELTWDKKGNDCYTEEGYVSFTNGYAPFIVTIIGGELIARYRKLGFNNEIKLSGG